LGFRVWGLEFGVEVGSFGCRGYVGHERRVDGIKDAIRNEPEIESGF